MDFGRKNLGVHQSQAYWNYLALEQGWLFFLLYTIFLLEKGDIKTSSSPLIHGSSFHTLLACLFSTCFTSYVEQETESDLHFFINIFHLRTEVPHHNPAHLLIVYCKNVNSFFIKMPLDYICCILFATQYFT